MGHEPDRMIVTEEETSVDRFPSILLLVSLSAGSWQNISAEIRYHLERLSRKLNIDRACSHRSDLKNNSQSYVFGHHFLRDGILP
jgi:hypothetical protein